MGRAVFVRLVRMPKASILSQLFRGFFIFLGLGGLAVAIFILKTNTLPNRQSPAIGCINNLRQIDGAKNEWALLNHKTNGEEVTETDIKPYILLDRAGKIPHCPVGGNYNIGRVGDTPTCSLGATVTPAHVLP